MKKTLLIFAMIWSIFLTGCGPSQPTTAIKVNLAPSEPGEYLIVCSTAGHYAAGMTGKLLVVAE